MQTATLTAEGQIAIPDDYREELRLNFGDEVGLEIENGRLVVSPVGGRARLVKSADGRRVLVAPDGAPPMTPEYVKELLADFP